MLKKVTKLLIAGCILATVLSAFAPSSKAACRPTNLGTQCDNDVLLKKRVKVYYTKNQVNKVVSRYNNMGSNKGLILGYIIGLAHPSAGLSVLMYQVGANNMIKPFKTAKSKKKGLEISYTVTVYKWSNASTKVSGVKYKYR
ncbi:hypothetical protein QRX25_18605 [Bacillus sp. L381]|uniref:Uncharacterized protein n=1 Tax=Bacillus amyloliquefaciens TaxID=1390 RepID=A0AAP7N6X0_BACAM|nr:MULTISPECIES: hypothetical protein [Bacillus]MCR9039950.1 hypothetical protein [Bacillus velezensis]OIK21255.1 hypothetical protein BKP66_06695 [Bacillus amyloliquefaciens]QUN09453.1 hypothetical protein KEF49_18395 [Bacillus amyloliquefaciens]QYM82530.1 hypothetical protein KTJ85_18245 [Bacillus sp. 7D3]QZY11761.1 hypothetical protein K7B13_18965 [Bacillus amyloliquefaciens]